uniref:DUF8040 domain-containing protein n=1 Tax=Lactuca sativa TaxID=4236 RepID=A0A9R1V625_LACSA|nr:hypothetical protein LSAT_V11C600307790 [Lactuca sativa]
MSYHNGRDSIRDMVYKSDKTSVVNIRMNRNVYKRLCDMLEQRGGLKNSKNVSKFLCSYIYLHIMKKYDYSRIIQKMWYVDYIKSSTRNPCQYPMMKPTRGGGGLRLLIN